MLRTGSHTRSKPWARRRWPIFPRICAPCRRTSCRSGPSTWLGCLRYVPFWGRAGPRQLRLAGEFGRALRLPAMLGGFVLPRGDGARSRVAALRSGGDALQRVGLVAVFVGLALEWPGLAVGLLVSEALLAAQPFELGLRLGAGGVEALLLIVPGGGLAGDLGKHANRSAGRAVVSEGALRVGECEQGVGRRPVEPAAVLHHVAPVAVELVGRSASVSGAPVQPGRCGGLGARWRRGRRLPIGSAAGDLLLHLLPELRRELVVGDCGERLGQSQAEGHCVPEFGG